MTHVSKNTGNPEWYTPPAIIEAARNVLGEIDLDPASSEIAQRAVRAERFFTAETDGLAQPWAGRVWMNPPYNRNLCGRFVTKLLNAHRSMAVPAAITLTNNATETKWGSALLAASTGVCFPTGRIRFLDPDGNPGAPLQGQMICFLGPLSRLGDFKAAFEEFGPVLAWSV